MSDFKPSDFYFAIGPGYCWEDPEDHKGLTGVYLTLIKDFERTNSGTEMFIDMSSLLPEGYDEEMSWFFVYELSEKKTRKLLLKAGFVENKAWAKFCHKTFNI